MLRGMTASLARVGPRLFEPRIAARVVAGLLAVYAIGFLVFYPATVTVADEGTYIRQAQLMLQGRTAVDVVDPFTGQPTEIRPISGYPLGTALLLMPFVQLGGREAANLLGLLSTIVGVAVTARLLGRLGHSPLWAVLLLGYPATVVMGRIAMSEAPSLMVVSLGLLLYFRGLSSGGPSFLAAGFAAGFSFALRETNVLVFAPLFVGSLVRRDRGWPALVVGGAVGLSIRALSAWLFFDDPFFTKPPDEFSLGAIAKTAPTYLFALLVLVPGGLLTALAYRGPRRAEVITTVLGFAIFYMTYSYSAEPSGIAKRFVLGPRYFIPLLPLLAVTAADVWPRWGAFLRSRLSAGTARIADAAFGAVVSAAVVALACALVGVQWAHADWATDQARVRDAIYRYTDEGSVIVTNWRATGKFIDLVGGRRIILRRENLQVPHLRGLLQTKGSFFVVFLDRSDSTFWRRNAFENSLFVNRLGRAKELVFELEVSPTDHLRIWRVSD